MRDFVDVSEHTEVLRDIAIAFRDLSTVVCRIEEKMEALRVGHNELRNWVVKAINGPELSLDALATVDPNKKEDD